MTVWEVTFPLALSSHHILIDTTASNCTEKEVASILFNRAATACALSKPCRKSPYQMPCCYITNVLGDAADQLQLELIFALILHTGMLYWVYLGRLW